MNVSVGAWVVLQGAVCLVVPLNLEVATCIVDRIAGFIFQPILLAMSEKVLTLHEI
ncbi:hypothetical protein [Bacillus thuringiensis]|uniref:hypothetical protein n=1 Tax=Bacillus thuringiensis TaxID=1428 RepID=UPI00159B8EE2|nr:hypothetical protein [Bacillus thuringiensis]